MQPNGNITVITYNYVWVQLLIWVGEGEADWEVWSAVPTVTEVNGNGDSSSLVNMVICYFGPNITVLTTTVTMHLAPSLAENAAEQSFSTLESGPPRGVTAGVTKDFPKLARFMYF